MRHGHGELTCAARCPLGVANGVSRYMYDVDEPMPLPLPAAPLHAGGAAIPFALLCKRHARLPQPHPLPHRCQPVARAVGTSAVNTRQAHSLFGPVARERIWQPRSLPRSLHHTARTTAMPSALHNLPCERPPWRRIHTKAAVRATAVAAHSHECRGASDRRGDGRRRQ